MEPVKQIEVLEGLTDADTFYSKLKTTDLYPLRANGIQILQINVGKRCNMSCKHCHVEAGPERTEVMPEGIFKKCFEIIENSDIGTIDITGGSPEMNPDLEWFIKSIAKLNRRLIVRSNLIILLDENYSHFKDLYAEQGVEIEASLPDYRIEKSDRQRGKDSFIKAIEVITKLNEKGYGIPGSGLTLNLVHNPVGAYLPGPQNALEYEYKRVLEFEYGIKFNGLFCLSNCPVGRYLEFLLRTDNFEDYMSLLIQAFNPAAANNVMCRTTLSVGWDGTLYDCDFNQMLDLKVNHGVPTHIDDFDMEKLRIREIVINNHCYACTAGAGSSCQGSLD